MMEGIGRLVADGARTMFMGNEAVQRALDVESAELALRAVLDPLSYEKVTAHLAAAPARDRPTRTIGAVEFAKMGLSADLIVSDALDALVSLQEDSPYRTPSAIRSDAEDIGRIVNSFDVRGRAVRLIPNLIHDLRQRGWR